ncbi:YitT family protein [Metabacillus herbersteinensis]|uniref:YitT family protein n=1 Tax=Metabacillus herbersteinensis TaxID=283816 RepID=A0ABV6GH64_9BACI
MNILLKSCILGIGAIVQGFAMAVFLFPHLIPSGGAASVGVLFNHLLNVPFAITLWVLNACLLLAATKWLGKSSALWTMYCVTMTSATVNLIMPSMIQPISNVLIDLIIGSVFFGIGLGILFRMGASSGGMDILALIIAKSRGLTPGKPLFWINGSILLLTGIVVDWKIIVYAVVCQFIGTRILDSIYKLKFINRKSSMKEQRISNI